MSGALLHPSSYLGIFVFLVLTGCGMPIPEEVAIVIAGVLSAEGQLLTSAALAACLSGAIVGDCALYSIGYWGGRRLLNLHPRLAKLFGADQERRFEQAIERHAFKVMFLSRFMVGVRGPVYLAAGVVRMPFRLFVFYDSVCATLVVAFFFAISYVYGDDVAGWLRRAEWTVTLIAIAAVLAIGGLLYFRPRQLVLQAIFGSDLPVDR